MCAIIRELQIGSQIDICGGKTTDSCFNTEKRNEFLRAFENTNLHNE